jgi:hypothetical protein
MGEGNRPPDDPDVEVGAAASARRLRFRRKPQVDVKTRAHLEVNPELAEELDADVEGGSRAERQNLPEEVEPGVTYRDVRVGWRAGAALRHDEDSEDER